MILLEVTVVLGLKAKRSGIITDLGFSDRVRSLNLPNRTSRLQIGLVAEVPSSGGAKWRGYLQHISHL